MKHFMLDLYGVRTDTTDMNKINEIMNGVINKLGLKAVMPVQNLPYYYCQPAADGGISSFCLLDNGHVTLHTFPFYGTSYADIMCPFAEAEKVKMTFEEFLTAEKTDFWAFDRDSEECIRAYSPENDFGPHVLVSADTDKNYSIGDIYEILEALPRKIGMNPITRPFIVTNRLENYSVISGIIIIAESHISFHFNQNTGKVYFDIYSCKFCDTEILHSAAVDLFGNSCRYQLISRGQKHSKIIKKEFSLSSNEWRNNI